MEASPHAARRPAHAYPDESRRGSREHWKAPAGTSVAAGVAFSVFLMAVASGVQVKIDRLISQPAFLTYQPADIRLVSSILLWLTIVVTGAMLLQTAITTFTQGVSLMRARRDEVAIRRQCGVLRGTLVLEFARAMLGPCLIGGLLGEGLGLVAALLLHRWTIVPVHFTPVSTLSAFPVTVVLALAATLIPAWRLANASPALLRKE